MKDLMDMTRGELGAEASAFAATHAGDTWEMLPARRRGRRIRGETEKVGLFHCNNAQLRAFLRRARRAEFVWLRAAMRRAVAEAYGDLDLLRYALAVLRRDCGATRPRRRASQAASPRQRSRWDVYSNPRTGTRVAVLTKYGHRASRADGGMK